MKLYNYRSRTALASPAEGTPAMSIYLPLKTVPFLTNLRHTELVTFVEVHGVVLTVTVRNVLLIVMYASLPMTEQEQDV